MPFREQSNEGNDAQGNSIVSMRVRQEILKYVVEYGIMLVYT